MSPNHPVVSREEWLAARKRHLDSEKEFTRLRDKLARERRELPWVRVEKPYVFEGPQGRETLAQLFGARRAASPTPWPGSGTTTATEPVDDFETSQTIEER